MKTIEIKMLGEFSLTAGDRTLSDKSTRAKKVWALLAYLLCNKASRVSARKIISSVWTGEDDNTNPENTLRITLHRLRTLLDGLWEGAGMELVLYKNGSYMWNPAVQVVIDAEEFEKLLNGEYANRQTKLENYLKAMEMYNGEFLPRFSGELWAIPISAHYHNLYLPRGMETCEMLLKNKEYEKAIGLCRAIALTEPYHEPLHQLLMEIYGAKGDKKSAATVYESLRRRLMDDFGLYPTEKTGAVYRRNAFSPETRTIPVDEVMTQLQEPERHGALICDYDYFKVICFAKKRAMERESGETHVALLSLTARNGDRLSLRILEEIMEPMEKQLARNLRRGDILSQCSTSQFILMLPQANFENSNMVCRRIIAAYRHAYPKTNVKINYIVYPLTPDAQVP